MRCQAIDDPNDLVGAILELEPGSPVAVDVLRNGKRQTVNVELGRRPALRRPTAATG